MADWSSSEEKHSFDSLSTVSSGFCTVAALVIIWLITSRVSCIPKPITREWFVRDDRRPRQMSCEVMGDDRQVIELAHGKGVTDSELKGLAAYKRETVKCCG
jgi:hypothetical protein